MDINKICSDICELFTGNIEDIPDMREYYYMIRKTLDDSFDSVVTTIIEDEKKDCRLSNILTYSTHSE